MDYVYVKFDDPSCIDVWDIVWKNRQTDKQTNKHTNMNATEHPTHATDDGMANESNGVSS